MSMLTQKSSEIKTVSENESGVDLLEIVFENGEIIRTQTFEEIKSRATIQELINI